MKHSRGFVMLYNFIHLFIYFDLLLRFGCVYLVEIYECLAR